MLGVGGVNETTCRLPRSGRPDPSPSTKQTRSETLRPTWTRSLGLATSRKVSILQTPIAKERGDNCKILGVTQRWSRGPECHRAGLLEIPASTTSSQFSRSRIPRHLWAMFVCIFLSMATASPSAFLSLQELQMQIQLLNVYQILNWSSWGILVERILIVNEIIG